MSHPYVGLFFPPVFLKNVNPKEKNVMNLSTIPLFPKRRFERANKNKNERGGDVCIYTQRYGGWTAAQPQHPSKPSSLCFPPPHFPLNSCILNSCLHCRCLVGNHMDLHEPAAPLCKCTRAYLPLILKELHRRNSKQGVIVRKHKLEQKDGHSSLTSRSKL